MSNHKWDLKSNYILGFTICKYGIGVEQWNLVANDLGDYINTTPHDCQAQFDRLCQEYGRDWEKQSVEPLHNYIFSIIKRLYYDDLCERMTESRDLLMVMYDFIRLFKTGRINLNNINEILHDVKNAASTDNNTSDNERQQKIKMLERLKLHMTRQNPGASNVQSSSFPVAFLPPPPFFQQQQPVVTNYISSGQTILTTDENDRQVPSMDSYPKSSITGASSFPTIIQSNNLFIEKETSLIKMNPSNEVDIDEIELSSDDDDDDNDRTEIAHMSNIDEPTTTSNLVNDREESTSISDEPMETSQSSNILPVSTEISTSNDRDLYDTVSTTSISNPSTFDTRLSADERATSSTNGQPVPSDLQLHTSISGSSDYMTSDNDRIQSLHNPYHHSHEIETTPQRIPVDDDEVARMDAEQIPEPIPADITDVTVPNDNAVFIVDGFVSNGDSSRISTKRTDEPAVTSSTTLHEMERSSQVQEMDESTTPRSLRRQPRATNFTSNNFRKTINSILNSLKTAKYGYDFSAPLKSFKLPNEYYIRIKKPLDIPEIRERMNNGDYDENILLFERDILLMFTNALTMYHRDIEIHAHAQYMMKYTMELLASTKEVITPWEKETNGDSSNTFRLEDDHDNGDSVNSSSITHTSSVRSDSSTKHLRGQITPKHSTNKRQRKTMH